MLTRYACSPNQGILKSPVAEEFQIARERRLVAAAKRGCPAAFGELCQPCTKIILPKIQKITRNREDAEDALQDSFLRAFLHIKGFDGRSKFSTWLTRIAINSALMIVRKRYHSAELSLSEEASEGVWEVLDHLPNPEILHAQRERALFLLTAIENLRPGIRQVVQHQLQERSIREMAQILDISIVAAKARLFHARTALRNSARLKAIAHARAESAASSRIGKPRTA